MRVPLTRRRFRGVLAIAAALWLPRSPALASEAPAIVKDVFPGPSSSIRELGIQGVPPALSAPVDAGGAFFFPANDGTSGTELWRSDGTEGGTFRLKDIVPGAGGSSPWNFVTAGGLVYFKASDGAGANHLWRSDGTEAGTFPLKAVTSSIEPPVAIGGAVFFAGLDGGLELWRTDGTLEGTMLVRDLSSSVGGGSPTNLTAVGATLFFVAGADNGGGRELWRSDGTAPGTLRVKDIHPGPNSSNPDSLVAANGLLFFTATDGTSSSNLWRSDGTPTGTFRIENVNAAGPSGGVQCARSPLSQLVDFGGTLFFAGTANDGTGDLELWRSDGTEAGTFRVKDIFPGPNPSSPYCFVDAGGTLFFGASDGTAGQELWRTDGTEAGTFRVKDVSPGGGNSTPRFLTDAGGTLFFTASDALGGELWRSDGTEAGTLRVADINPGGASTPENLRYAGGTLFFSANDGTRGREPWVLVFELEPLADAGTDQTVDEGTDVTLDGSASSDPDGDPLGYQWEQIGGPTVTLSDSATARPGFVAPSVPRGGATLTFQLTVSDGTHTSEADAVNVTVKNQNQPPVADAGENHTVQEGSPVTLHGGGSFDPDSDPLAYQWAQSAGPEVSLSDPAAAEPTFTAPAVCAAGETLVFQLVVSDGTAASGPDTVSITVFPANQPPACGLARPRPSLLRRPNHKLVPVFIAGVADPDDRHVRLTVTAVTQDEPVNGRGDGDTSPDAVLAGPLVLLRAERAGAGTGRVYRVTFVAEDASGATCTGSVTVCVPRDHGTDACVDEGQRYDSLAR
jgi:ELWxxDGT repeat protein